MNVLTLLGSARKKGNTAAILKWVENELESSGHNIESIYLNSKQINGCIGCAKCKEKPDETGCVQNDDAEEILQKIIKADLTIFSSPLYFWGFTSQLKTIIDRSYSLVTNYHKPDHSSLIEGKRQALLVTGGGDYEENAEPSFFAFDKLIKFYKGVKSGELFIGGCTTPDDMDEKTEQKARAFARKIVEP